MNGSPSPSPSHRGTVGGVRGRNDLTPVRRDRLLRRAGGAAVVYVEAPGGFGKSSFALQLATSLDQAVAVAEVDEPGDVSAALLGSLRTSGLSDLAGALDAVDPSSFADAIAARPGGVAIVIDEVQRATPASVAWLVGLVERCGSPSRLIVVGRRLGRDLAALATAGPPGSFVTADDLRFDLAESTEVLRGIAARGLDPAAGSADDVIDILHRLTAGWPAAVALAGARLAVGGHLPTTAGSGSLAELVERQLDGSDERSRDIVRDLAHLPLLSAEVTSQAIGPGALDVLLDVGLPVRFRPDGWGEIADPVREHLTDGHRPSPGVVERAAAVYARRGELLAAAILLSRHGRTDDLVGMLSTASPRDLSALGAPSLRVLLDGIDDRSIAGHLDLLVRVARAVEGIDPPLRTTWIDRARHLAGHGSVPDRVARAIATERARDLSRLHQMDEAIEILDEVLARCEADELTTRGRASLSLGLIRLVNEQGTASSTTVELLEQAASSFRAAGDIKDEAVALRALGFGVNFNRGAFEAASEQMGRAAELLGTPDSSRAMFLTFVAEIDRDLGRLDAADSALHESLSIGRRLGDRTAISYAAWELALVAGERRDRAGVDRWTAEARSHADGWIEAGAGVDYFAMVAEVLVQTGDRDAALEHVEAAERHPAAGDYVWPARSARARFETVFGDPVVAERVLDELDAIAPPRERPLRLLTRAASARRRGDTVRADRLLDEAVAASREMGDPMRLERREPELLAIVRGGTTREVVPAIAVDHSTRGDHPEDPASGGSAAGGEVGSAPVSVRMLGRFEVTGAGNDLTPPVGRAATIVKVLALRGAVTAEAAIDLLWDDCDPDTGRARLRNLLNRVRSASGPIVERSGDLLRLAAGLEVDVDRFERAAARVGDTDPSGRVGAARAALAIYAGDLLPGDLYEDWAASARERLRRQHLALVDLVARDALEHHELDEALRLLDIGIDAEPYDVWRYRAAAEALRTQGRAASAAALAARGLRATGELGLPADPVLVALASSAGDVAS